MQLLCRLNDLPDGDSRGFRIDNHSLLAVRRGEHVYVYRNDCPHRGIPLEWQPDRFLDYEKQFIQCATHGALFTIENGECVAGPCPGEMLESIPCRIENDQVLIDLLGSHR